MKILGFVLIVAGVILMAYTGFNFSTTEKVVDLGTVTISQEKDHPVEWSPVIGIALTVALL